MKQKIICASPYFKSRKNIWYTADFPEYKWELCYPILSTTIPHLIGRYNFDRLNRIKQTTEVAIACRDPATSLAIICDEALTFWCARFMPKGKFPIISWSFNYHTLPRGRRYRLMQKAFQRVNRFVVHSTLEKQEYAKYFDLNPDRIDILLWCMGKPTIDSPRLLEGDYICALGENARDYQTLMAVMKRLPEIRLELVVRPYNLIGLELPPNVRVHLDIPRSQAMNILYHSRFMVLPLQGATVYNGHVTLVAAQHLGKAMIVTDSVGITDYIFAGQNAEVYPAFDAEALTNCITRLWHDPHRCQMLGDYGQTFAANNLTENNAKSYLKQLLHTYIETPE